MARPRKQDTVREYKTRNPQSVPFDITPSFLKNMQKIQKTKKELEQKYGTSDLTKLTDRLERMQATMRTKAEDKEYEVNPLKCTLSIEQLDTLLPLFNSSILSATITAEQAMNLLKGEIETPIVIVNTRLFSFLLMNLSKKGLICSNYQTTVQRLKLYITKQGKEITQRKISSALTFIDKDYGNLSLMYESRWYEHLTHCQLDRLRKYQEIEKLCNKLV